MRARPCLLTTTTRLGHQSIPVGYPSLRKAREQGRWMVKHGYAFSYSVTLPKTDTLEVRRKEKITKEKGNP